jgi:inorganic pyrophosphatase
MTNLLDLPNFLDPAERTCRAIIETPQGRRCKYDYDASSGLFELAGILPAGMSFPLAFGFIPSTRGEDGDPIDILVLAEEDLPIGCLLSVTILGIMEADQTEGGQIFRNDRLIARPLHSRLFADIEEVADLGEAFADELSRFFTAYNELKGKSFMVRSIGDATHALSSIAGACR